MKQRTQHGFSIVAAIFILVVLSALAGFIVSVTSTQNISLAQDVQAARALQAARTGIEWGTSRWLNTKSCTGSGGYGGTPPKCSPANVDATCTQETLYTPSGSNPAGLEAFNLVVILCSCPAPPAGGTCQITATASVGSVGALGFIERQMNVVVEGN